MRNFFSSIVVKELKYYVYIYSHPITEEIFYIGKGKGNRVFSHLDESKKSQKFELIKEIRGQGLRPKIEILVHGLEDEKTALRMESAIIDLIGINNLTNELAGYKSATFGRMSIAQVNATYQKEEVEILEPSILIRINQAFRYSMEEVELYDYTRGQWRIDPERAKSVKYAFAIYKGIIQEVYSVINWFEAGETYSVRRDNKFIEREKEERIEGRYEFIGNIAPSEIRKKYRFKSAEHYFKKGNSNPVMYLNA